MVKRKTKRPPKQKLGLNHAPTDSWFRFYDYFRTEVDSKTVTNIMKTYIRENFSRQQKTTLLSAPESIYGMSVGAAASIYWSNLKLKFPSNWNSENSIRLAISNIKKFAKSVKKEESDIPKISPMKILKRKTDDFLASVETIVDDWEENSDYSIFAELQKIEAAQNTAKSVYDYYKPVRDEIAELVEKKSDDLLEAYDNMPNVMRKQYLKFLNDLVSGAEQYYLNKKTARKPRKSKTRTADKQIEKLQFLSESQNYMLTSVNPSNIIGAMRLYTFNTLNRVLTEYVSRSAKGFEVKGTTLQMWDEDISRSIKLRKPEEILPLIQKNTISKNDKVIKGLTTKPTKSNGRINKHTILLRVLNK